MEAPLKYKILRIINEVYNESVNSKLNETVIGKLDIQLSHLAKYFSRRLEILNTAISLLIFLKLKVFVLCP